MDNNFYPAKVLEIHNSVKCKAMERICINWKLPDKCDIMWYSYEDIVHKMSPLETLNSKGFLSVSEIEPVYIAR